MARYLWPVVLAAALLVGTALGVLVSLMSFGVLNMANRRRDVGARIGAG